MAELPANRQPPGAVVRARADSAAAEHAVENLDLGLHEPDAGVTASGASFDEEVRENVEPPEHGM